jgi:NAD(P)-dependent dehydrogenase (short-subunit alcohol dehydrogenase family)
MAKTWLVTGSSRGLGRKLAEAVLAAGDNLVATARKPEQLDDLVKQYGNRVRAVALDVTDEKAAEHAVTVAEAAFGGLDVVVNNAGYGDIGSIEDMSSKAFRDQIETNFFGVVNVTRAALPIFRKQKSGHFLQVSSIGGRLGSAGLGAYQSAKWAVGGFSEVLAKEVAPLGIKVTVIEPGGFRTDWAGSSMTIENVSEAYRDTVGVHAQHARANDGKQQGDPERAAQVMLKVAEMENPPLRLLLGSDAVFLAKMVSGARAAEDEKNEALSVSTDFPGTPDVATKLAKLLKSSMKTNDAG